jgi:hypothetical protein
MTFLIFMLGLAVGAVAMHVAHVALAKHNSTVQAERREQRRRNLALEDRPAAQPDAVGNARITTANIKREVRGR